MNVWPAGSLEETLEAQRLMCFPHGSQFCDLLVDPACGVKMWCDDASNYYYLLRWPKARWHETLIGDAFSASKLLELGAMDRDGKLAACGDAEMEWGLCCPAMGDQKAAHAAQALHQGVLRAGGSLTWGRWLTYGFAPPGDRLWEGVYQDDHALLELGAPGDGFPEGPSGRERVHKIYVKVGCERK